MKKSKIQPSSHNKDKWEKVLRQAVAEFLKALLKKQMEWEREVYTEETGEAKYGYDPRKGLRTMFGPIRDLKIPRIREGGMTRVSLSPINGTRVWKPWCCRWLTRGCVRGISPG